jgi:hypothetical protein
MRRHAVVLTALTVVAALPSESIGQRIPLPRIGRRPTAAQPAPLPPEAPAVTRALAYRRSRWSVEGYPFVSQIQVPTASGDASTYTMIGSGSHGDYRMTDHFAMTFDLTSTLPLTTTMAGTVELGTRFRPMLWGENIQPYLDIRGAYSYLSDMYATPSQVFAPGTGSDLFLSETGRRSRGVGGLIGAGFEYYFTRSMAVTTGVTAARSHMTAYRLAGFAVQPNTSAYWMTSARYTLGLKFNPVRVLRLDQNPRQ